MIGMCKNKYCDVNKMQSALFKVAVIASRILNIVLMHCLYYDIHYMFKHEMKFAVNQALKQILPSCAKG